MRLNRHAADAGQVARFAASLNALLPPARAGAAKLGLAVSGGGDSMAMLVLAAAAFPGRIEAATVDHGLRAESAEEAALVARTCAALDVPHQTLGVVVAEGNLQDAARAARYAALGQWAEARGVVAVLTAHHADDQAETLVARLNRASGVAGLAGVRAAGRVPGTGLLLLRPLLEWRREELAQVTAAAGIAPVDDPSNRDARFDRARIRAGLGGAEWIDVAALARSAAHLADADAALGWAAAREWRENVTPGALGSFVYRPSAPRAVAIRVLTLLVAKMDGAEPRGGSAARLFETLLAGQPASIGNLVARATSEGWTFTRAPRRRS